MAVSVDDIFFNFEACFTTSTFSFNTVLYYLLLVFGEISIGLDIPSKLLTSTVTPNFDMVSQIIVKILGAQQFEIGNLSQKLFSLKYFS